MNFDHASYHDLHCLESKLKSFWFQWRVMHLRTLMWIWTMHHTMIRPLIELWPDNIYWFVCLLQGSMLSFLPLHMISSAGSSTIIDIADHSPAVVSVVPTRCSRTSATIDRFAFVKRKTTVSGLSLVIVWSCKWLAQKKSNDDSPASLTSVL